MTIAAAKAATPTSVAIRSPFAGADRPFAAASSPLHAGDVSRATAAQSNPATNAVSPNQNGHTGAGMFALSPLPGKRTSVQPKRKPIPHSTSGPTDDISRDCQRPIDLGARYHGVRPVTTALRGGDPRAQHARHICSSSTKSTAPHHLRCRASAAGRDVVRPRMRHRSCTRPCDSMTTDSNRNRNRTATAFTADTGGQFAGVAARWCSNQPTIRAEKSICAGKLRTP